MTEKRFRISEVFELNRPFPIYDGDCPLTQKEASDLLNELHEENQRLKSDKTNLHRTMSRDRVKYCQFKDKVFYCIDKKIKLFKDCCMSNEVKILEDLKKEMDI